MDDLSGLMKGLGGEGGTAAGSSTAASGLAGALTAEGLDTLVAKLREGGFGEQVDSWIGGGPNRPLEPQQLGAALGESDMQKMSAASGLDIGALMPLLAAFLPQIVNLLTPGGKAPREGLDAAVGGGGMPDLGGLLGGLMGGAPAGSGSAGGFGDLMGGLGGLLGGDKER